MKGKGKEKTSGEIWLSTVVDARTRQAFLKHESPLMELGDKQSHTHAACECVCVSVSLSLRVCTTTTHVLKTSMSGFEPMPPSKVIHCTYCTCATEVIAKIHPHYLAHLNKYKLKDKFKKVILCAWRDCGTGDRGEGQGDVL